MQKPQVRNFFVQFSPDVYEELETTAEREGRSKRSVIERALAAYCAQSEAEAEVKARLARMQPNTPTAA